MVLECDWRGGRRLGRRRELLRCWSSDIRCRGRGDTRALDLLLLLLLRWLPALRSLGLVALRVARLDRVRARGFGRFPAVFLEELLGGVPARGGL